MVLWSVTDILLIAAYFRRFRKQDRQIKSDDELPSEKKINLSSFALFLLIGVVIIVLSVAVLAVMSGPNNPDSMRYHMSRVAHWIQNSSVSHYPTHTVKQLYQNPWSEFAIMHFQILSGGDRFANLIQWGSMVGSLVGVSLIARQLGANFRGQLLTTVICATIPMGILQGASTQNDYVVALWLVCFAYYTLVTVKEGATIANTSKLGASLGLAILTKGTAYIYALPFCIWLGIWGIKTLRWQVWKPLITVTVLILAINGGHYTRNLILFATPLGVPIESETNQAFSLSILIGNITKQLSLHADIVRNLKLEKIITPLTGITEKAIKIIHGILGLDVSDPRLMSPKASRFYVPAISTYEDTAGNPLHLLLILLSTIFLAINSRLKRQPYLVSYFLAVAAGFFFFCFLFTWSPWRCRLHLPLFVLLSAFVGVILSKSLNYRITNILAVILLLLSHPWILNNKLKPLVGKDAIFNTPRIEHYFITKKNLQTAYIEASNVVKSQNCSTIGLMGNQIWYEYPLWALFPQAGKTTIIKHVDVNNNSLETATQFPVNSSQPCAIISVDRHSEEVPKKELVIEEEIYDRYWSRDWDKGNGSVTVFVPQKDIE